MTDLPVNDPERALAIAYAPTSARPALAALFALDERLGAIVAGTTEPTFGLIRLAWWREALERLDQSPPPAEPLLSAIAREVLPHGVAGAAVGAIEEGWAALLQGEPDAAAIGLHAARGRHLFAAAAIVLGDGDPRLAVAGEGWALADLGHRHSQPAVREEARRQARERLASIARARWSPAARPLAMLAMLARGDAQDPGSRRQGSPARLARMLAMRLLGR